MNFSEQQSARAHSAKSAEELRKAAEENGIVMTDEEAEKIFSKLNPPSRELSDDELDNVAGGGCGGNDNKPAPLYSVGQTVVLASCKDSTLICRKYCTVTKMQYKNNEWVYTVDRYGLTEDYRESELCAI